MIEVPYVDDEQPTRLYLIAAMLRDSGQNTIAEDVLRAAAVLAVVLQRRKEREAAK